MKILINQFFTRRNVLQGSDVSLFDHFNTVYKYILNDNLTNKFLFKNFILFI